MIDWLAKVLHINHDRAEIIVRTFWQAAIALILVFALQIANHFIDLFKEGLLVGMGAVALTVALTIAGAIIDNVRAFKKHAAELTEVPDAPV